MGKYVHPDKNNARELITCLIQPQITTLFSICFAHHRNPVTNIATMTTATDIRDWCDVEALGTYDFSNFRAASKEELGKMWDASPCRYAENVKAKVLVAVGLMCSKQLNKKFIGTELRTDTARTYARAVHTTCART